MFDSFSIPADFGVDPLEYERLYNLENIEGEPRSPAYPPPIRPSLPPSATSVEPSTDVDVDVDVPQSILKGEELDLLNWDTIEGPQTVVCWPYHGVGGRHVEWWWTMVIEKVKKPLRHL